MNKFGCNRKLKKTIRSRLTNLRPAKQRAKLNKIPISFSLKEKFPNVYTQTCGCCTSCAVLACDYVKYHEKRKYTPSYTFTYWNQKHNEHPMIDDGSNVECALHKVKKFGSCNAKIWSNEEAWYKRPTEQAFVNGKKGKAIKKWYEVKSLEQIRQALVNGYPVASAVAWCFRDYDENFVLNTPTQEEAETCHSGHAIVIVGYDDVSGLVEIRNSWSEKWANGGYAYMTYEALQRVIWFNDTYAIIK